MHSSRLGVGPGPEGFFATKPKHWCSFCGLLTTRLFPVWPDPDEPHDEEYLFCGRCIREFDNVNPRTDFYGRSLIRRVIEVLRIVR